MTYPQTILLTDDEPHMRKFIGFILRKFDNPQILEAGDGTQALALYKQHQPDLVLLDISMPHLDGVQALAQIKQHDPHAIVVMLSSLANRQTVEECLRLGAAEFIRKDTPREEMIAKFERVIADCYGAEVPA